MTLNLSSQNRVIIPVETYNQIVKRGRNLEDALKICMESNEFYMDLSDALKEANKKKQDLIELQNKVIKRQNRVFEDRLEEERKALKRKRWKDAIVFVLSGFAAGAVVGSI